MDPERYWNRRFPSSARPIFSVQCFSFAVPFLSPENGPVFEPTCSVGKGNVPGKRARFCDRLLFFFVSTDSNVSKFEARRSSRRVSVGRL